MIIIVQLRHSCGTDLGAGGAGQGGLRALQPGEAGVAVGKVVGGEEGGGVGRVHYHHLPRQDLLAGHHMSPLTRAAHDLTKLSLGLISDGDTP